MLGAAASLEILCRRYQDLAAEAIRSAASCPNDISGRGIVTCAGGSKYFPCVWVTIRELRRLGCKLPVEIWHLGRNEMTAEMESLVTPLGAKCIDATLVRHTNPVRILNGWELKPYSILHSDFAEALFLDADNVPVKDPTYLFDAPEYAAHGAVFWPDFGRLAPSREIWKICHVPYRDEPEFESGQIVVDKRRCWREIQLTMHLNEHSDFYYDYIHGDKDTFHMAWRMLGTEYAMPPTPIHALQGVMCQHDFQGERVFQHRNLCKFKFSEDNRSVAGFLNEDWCFRHLAELRKLWSGVASGLAPPGTPSGLAAHERVCRQGRYEYQRVGYDQRPMRFEPNQRISEGANRMELAWDVIELENACVLRIHGENGVTCELRPAENGAWRGRWLKHEQMEIVLEPIDPDDEPNAA